MLKDKLIAYRHYCENEYGASSCLSSMFRPRFDYPGKIAAINKVLLDIDHVAVKYTSRDLDLLSAGKLSQILLKFRDQLPVMLKHELTGRQSFLQPLASNSIDHLSP